MVNADFTYTDLWWWFGQEDEIPDRVKASPRYQVNAELPPGHRPMRQVHALPARIPRRRSDRRGQRTAPQSIIYDQKREPAAHREGLAGLVHHTSPRALDPGPAGLPRGRIESFLHDAVMV